jgi:hypothetical protein
MKTICAWCGVVLSDGNGPTSHGICPPCKDSFAFQSGVSLQRFIDSFSSPVLVLGSDLDPETINASGSVTLLKTVSDVNHYSMGEVFECENSRLPEGCGRTVHCSGCAIRKTVTLTNETGEPQFSIPATLNTDESTVEYYISTVKAGDHVLLKVDKATEASSYPQT